MKKHVGTILALMVFLLSACMPSQQEGIEKIDQEGYEALLAETEVVLLDVRTRSEYEGGHIPGAVLVPVDQIARVEAVVPDKSTPVVVYCRSGNRSATAAQNLKKMGYETIYDLGGIQSWRGEVEKTQVPAAA